MESCLNGSIIVFASEDRIGDSGPNWRARWRHETRLPSGWRNGNGGDETRHIDRRVPTTILTKIRFRPTPSLKKRDHTSRAKNRSKIVETSRWPLRKLRQRSNHKEIGANCHHYRCLAMDGFEQGGGGALMMIIPLHYYRPIFRGPRDDGAFFNVFNVFSIFNV